jgi:hypothetical protein
MDHDDAQALCTSYGMNLVGLQTASKDAIINNYIAGAGYQRAAFWTSGELYNWPANNNPAQASYVWDITGALVTYTNWCFGQPNNYGGNEQYIVVYNGCWFDTSGDGSQFTICEEIDSVAGATAAVRATDPLNKK